MLCSSLPPSLPFLSFRFLLARTQARVEQPTAGRWCGHSSRLREGAWRQGLFGGREELEGLADDAMRQADESVKVKSRRVRRRRIKQQSSLEQSSLPRPDRPPARTGRL